MGKTSRDNFIKVVCAVLLSLGMCWMSGCGEEMRSLTGSFGTPAEIKCYSGGQLVYEGKSTGKPTSESGSDGYFWTDSQTNKLIEISADCVFSYE